MHKVSGHGQASIMLMDKLVSVHTNEKYIITVTLIFAYFVFLGIF